MGAGRNGKSKLGGTVDRVWRFFASVRLAIILIIVVSGLSLLGAFLPGIDVFHSLWFLGTGALLILNIIVCSLNRWGNIKSSVLGGPVKQKESFLTGGNLWAEIDTASLAQGTAAMVSQNVLRRNRYRVRVESDGDGIHIAGDKNRFFRLMTYVSHLSLILLVVAYLLTSYLGFHDNGVVVAEGETLQIGHNTGLAVKLVSFVDEYYADHTPRDYRSEVVLYENGLEAKQATIRVNHPLLYKGVRIYQSFFGPAVWLTVSQNGTALFQGDVPLDSMVASQGIQGEAGTFDLPGGLAAVVFSPSPGTGNGAIPAGRLAFEVIKNDQEVGVGLGQKGASSNIAGLDFTYVADAKFSGFQVSREPANILIWIASALFILGITLVFYFPHRQVWVLHQSQADGRSRLLVRVSVPRGYNGASELNTLVTIIRKELPLETTEGTK